MITASRGGYAGFVAVRTFLAWPLRLETLIFQFAVMDRIPAAYKIQNRVYSLRAADAAQGGFHPRSGGSGQCSRGLYGDDRAVLLFLFICEHFFASGFNCESG